MAFGGVGCGRVFLAVEDDTRTGNVTRGLQYKTLQFPLLDRRKSVGELNI